MAVPKIHNGDVFRTSPESMYSATSDSDEAGNFTATDHRNNEVHLTLADVTQLGCDDCQSWTHTPDQCIGIWR